MNTASSRGERPPVEAGKFKGPGKTRQLIKKGRSWFSNSKVVVQYEGGSMIRFFFSFCLTVVMARWIYAEVQMTLPEVVPAIDYALESVQIPTHDRWDGKTLGALVEDLQSVAGGFVETAHASELDYNSIRSYGRPVKGGFSRNSCRSGACETF